ncbi:MAG TPA: heme peroxidase family protein [Ktedonobacteraceae bacterium]|nr:heme peroxidase family protein [Ktedonobacteraceae bacterium]
MSHSCVIAPHLKDALSSQGDEGESKYGRMFPNLPCLLIDENILISLGKSDALMDMIQPDEQGALTDNPRIPAGFTFFGQFIAHDITADRSLLLHHARLKELRNFRKPRLDLECIYGAGPSGDPYLYDLYDSDKFLLGINDIDRMDDVPRNRQGRALVADPRNDTQLFVSQLHLAFLKFHNAVVDYLRARGVPPSTVFEEARRLVRWHYQWIVIHEFLPLTVGQELVDDILTTGPRFYQPGPHPFIPVEFADAAYRFGHSQIRPLYVLNDSDTQGRVFPECIGMCPVSHDHVIDWAYFFSVSDSHPPQASKRIDTRMAHSLIDLPVAIVGETETPEERSLAYRDLVRGEALDLPSGECLAREMGVEPLSGDEVGLNQLGWQGETPLWFYILKEAQVRYNGERLGEVGGRIVAEVLLGLINADPTSYLNADDQWSPSLSDTSQGDFTIANLLQFAGLA